jgi:radical SAM superfamily enzyme YgiQ (UPF0313 family)
MKVCLISAPTASELDNSNLAEVDALRMMAEHAPLGVLSLAAVLEAGGLEPEVVDLNRLYYAFHHSPKQTSADFCAFVASHLANVDAEFFGFSTVCSSYPLTIRIASEVKRLHPGSVVGLGGPQASVVDMQTLRAFPAIDLVVRGEAEHTLPQLLNALAGRSAMSTVAGVTFREGSEPVRTPDAPAILDLDSLPFPALHLIPHAEAAHVIPLELGRGCPFACTFCSTNDFFRRRFRLKSPERVLAEMRAVNAAYGVDTFDLVHDMFTVDRKRVVAFCEAMLAADEKFTWGCSARTDCIDDELIELMARAGCRGLFFGIETGSQRMQRIIDKGLNLAEAADRVRSCDRFRIKTAVSLIAGFHEETVDDLRGTTAFFMDSLRYDHADPQLCVLAPLAQTPMHLRHKDQLRLDDAVDDMSYRGWDQQPADQALIAQYPDIFPNFYTIPTPYVDHEFVKELRDFLLNGMKALRHLLLDLHQASGNVLEVFKEWRVWRGDTKGPFPDGGRADYYAGPGFPRDFVEFVQTQYLGGESLSAATNAGPLQYNET